MSTHTTEFASESHGATSDQKSPNTTHDSRVMQPPRQRLSDPNVRISATLGRQAPE